LTTLTIASRYKGPPESGNGGYVCGLVAVTLQADLRVRLLSPPPLETPLELEAQGEDEWLLASPGGPVARGVRSRLELDVPNPPRYVQAVWASQHYPGFREHPFPDCFVCGPHRRRGDGLRIFPGTLDSGLVAAPWLPADNLDGGDGKVGAEFLWAALDCPGYFAVSAGRRVMVLGEMQAHVDRRVHVGEPCTVIGWKIAAEGRRHVAGTAVFDEDGELCARARATWVELK
jgi:acyl-coenzyme A thioesterase PaaI-like protein